MPDQFVSVNSYHEQEGFTVSTLGIYVGYHRLITGGKNYKCREDLEHGCHTNQVVNGKSMNWQSLGICIGFNGDVEMPTLEDLNLFVNQVHQWQQKYNIPNANVLFHRQFNTQKTCPGALITQAWLVNNLWPVVPPATGPETVDTPHDIVKQGGVPEIEVNIGDMSKLEKLIMVLLGKL